MTTPPRFTAVSSTKRTGATATPALLAQALAEAMVAAWAGPAGDRVTILEPAVGDGVLVEALLAALAESGKARGCVLEVHAHDISAPALAQTRARLALRTGGQLRLHLHPGDFLAAPDPPPVDLVIANPPWVRTQVLGADRAQALARAHGLRGRLDLAHAFVVRSTALLAPGGIAGLWLSNKLLSTRGTAGLRALLRPRLRALWDLGATRLFDGAGIEFREENGDLFVDNLNFGGPSEQLGIDFDWQLAELEVPADRVYKEVFYLPALLLLGLIVLLQLRRKRHAPEGVPA